MVPRENSTFNLIWLKLTAQYPLISFMELKIVKYCCKDTQRNCCYAESQKKFTFGQALKLLKCWQ